MSNADGPHWIYCFGDFTLNTASGFLLKSGAEVKLRPQAFEVLQILLEQHGSLVSRDKLNADVWGHKAVTDDSLAQCLIDIRRAIDDTDRQIIRTVPRRGYSFIGDVAVESVDASPPQHSKRNRRQVWWWMAIAPFTIVLAWFGMTQLQESALQSTDQPIPESSVAVLPFVNMSADPENEYFSDGLAETLLHKLAHVRELKVAARTSSFAFKDKDSSIREIGAALGVAHVLEGSVRRDGNRIRVTAQLVRTYDGFHLWSETYDRELTDIFAIQDEIAGQVGVKLLASVLDPADVYRRRAADTSNVVAYDFYLRARAEIRNSSIEAMRKAEGYLLSALEEDPEFLDAKAELADLMLSQADTGIRSYAEGIAKQAELAGEVLASDPQHSRARSLLIRTQVVLAVNNGDFSAWKRAEPELRELVAAAPDDIDAKFELARLVGRFGDPEEAVALFNELLQIDPLNIHLYELLARCHSENHDYEAAHDVLRRAVEIDPSAPNAWTRLGDVALRLGDGVEAIDSYLKSQASDILDPELPGRTAEFLYELGLPEKATRFHERVLAIAPDSEDAQNLELLRAVALGELEEAVRLARDIIDDGPPERGIAWSNAWKVFLFTSVKREAGQDDIAFLDKHMQDFSDLDKVNVEWRTNLVRNNAVDVLAAVKTDADMRAFRKNLSDHLRQVNIDIANYSNSYLDWKVFFGNRDAAVQVALDDVFSNPVTTVPLWRLRFARPFMREFFSDPRMQEALHRWEQQEADIRATVTSYLADIEKNL